MKLVHAKERQKMALFKRLGYDIPKARQFIVDKAGIVQGRILEVGTGKGHMAMALAKKGLRLISIDLDRTAQKTARENLQALGLDRMVVLRRMNAEKLNYKNGSFDRVVSVNFIHHAQRPQQCIREMVRVTKDAVVIADLNKRGEAIMGRVHRSEGHKHEQTRMPLNEIKAYLKKLGLTVKTYRDRCQTVFVAGKQKERRP